MWPCWRKFVIEDGWAFRFQKPMPSPVSLNAGGSGLNEAYVLRVLPEALAAHVQPVFADQTVAVGADAARAGTLAELPWVTPVELLVLKRRLAHSPPTTNRGAGGRG